MLKILINSREITDFENQTKMSIQAELKVCIFTEKSTNCFSKILQIHAFQNGSFALFISVRLGSEFDVIKFTRNDFFKDSC